MERSTSVRATVERNVQDLQSVLARSTADMRPVAVMMCGIAGSGKSTYAKSIKRMYQSFQRLSIDQILADRRGIVGIDYPQTKYHEYQDEADAEFLTSLRHLLTDGAQQYIVLDRSFYAKEDRDEYRKLIEERGGRTVLLHLKASKETLWQRICERREAEINADSALDINRSLLDQYYDGFEWPQGEGEIVIDTDHNG